MPGKLFLLFVIFWFIFFVTLPVRADDVTPSPPPTCDLCGWCNQAMYPKPGNWNECMRCLYKPDGTPEEHTYYTVIGCLSTDPSAAPFVRSILSIVFGISGGIAFLSVLAGSATVLTSAGDPERLKNGKDMIFSSLIGLFLIIFSVFLLRVVGYDILRIPGFG